MTKLKKKDDRSPYYDNYSANMESNTKRKQRKKCKCKIATKEAHKAKEKETNNNKQKIVPVNTKLAKPIIHHVSGK